MIQHLCYVGTRDNPVICLCATNKDHDEYTFDDPNAPDLDLNALQSKWFWDLWN